MKISNINFQHTTVCPLLTANNIWEFLWWVVPNINELVFFSVRQWNSKSIYIISTFILYLRINQRENNPNNMVGRIDLFLYQNNDVCISYFSLLPLNIRPKVIVTLTSFLKINQQEGKNLLLFNQNTVK